MTRQKRKIDGAVFILEGMSTKFSKETLELPVLILMEGLQAKFSIEARTVSYVMRGTLSCSRVLSLRFRM